MSYDTDTTYTEAILGVWSIVEVNLGVVCCAAMRLKPLLVRWLPQLGLSSWSRKRTNSFGSKGTSSRGGLRTHPRPAHHTSQLHSVQKGSAHTADGDAHIHVYRQFDVTTEHDARSTSGSETESTAKINGAV
jgi:cobalamin biosynthesis Mg chelatase CobN